MSKKSHNVPEGCGIWLTTRDIPKVCIYCRIFHNIYAFNELTCEWSDITGKIFVFYYSMLFPTCSNLFFRVQALVKSSGRLQNFRVSNRPSAKTISVIFHFGTALKDN